MTPSDYPSDEDLERIQKWPFDEVDGALEFVQSIWHWPDFGIAKENGVLYLATGGWSGNESIIGAMQDNIGIWQRWICSSRGGAHEFELTNSHPDRETRFKLERENLQFKADRDRLAERVKQYEERITHVRKQLNCEGSSKPESCFIEELQHRLAAAEARVNELEANLRLNLAVAPDDPLLLTPIEQCLASLDTEITNWKTIVRDLTEQEERTRTVLVAFDASSPDGVEPLDSVAEKAVKRLARIEEAAMNLVYEYEHPATGVGDLVGKVREAKQALNMRGS